MKVTENQGSKPLTSGELVPVNIGLSDDPEDQMMILNVLANSLYTDKSGAVLREYGCNAFDANVEAGNGAKPIEVRLPNRLDASVSIRDFGFGMTEEQVLKVFCRLGRSTKRNSNEFTGMLGIGSKAGFAYGDSFMVTSYTNGSKAVYNCYKDRGRMLMTPMLVTKTDCPDGVEVKVPVRQEDIEEFVEKAERVFRYFKVRPIIHGAKIQYDDTAKRYEGTGWRYTGSGHSYAIMGNVGYDLAASHMGTNIPSNIRQMIQLGVELDFQIGELEIAANREGLQYKDLTRKSIADRVAVMAKELSTVFTTKIAGASSYWEACKMFGEIFERQGDYQVRELRNLVSGKITWKGEKIDSGRMFIGNEEKDPQVISITEFGKRSWGRGRMQITKEAEYMYAKDNHILCVNDLPGKKNSPLRVRGFFDTNKTAEALTIVTFDNDKAKDRWFKNRNMEGAPFILFSSVTPAAAAIGLGGTSPNAHKKKHSAKAFILQSKTANLSYGSTRSLFWDNVEVDYKNDKGVYVIVDKFFIVPPKNSKSFQNEHPYGFKQRFSELSRVGLAPSHVYAFKKTWVDANPARLGPGWVKLEDHIESVLKTLHATLAQEIADYMASAEHVELVNLDVRDHINDGSTLCDYLDALHKARNPKTKKALLDYVRDTRHAEPWVKPMTLPKPTVSFADMEKCAAIDYPMIAAWAEAYGSTTKLRGSKTKDQIIIDYANLVDSK